jgi:hypothetical protein
MVVARACQGLMMISFHLQLAIASFWLWTPEPLHPKRVAFGPPASAVASTKGDLFARNVYGSRGKYVYCWATLMEEHFRASKWASFIK